MSGLGILNNCSEFHSIPLYFVLMYQCKDGTDILEPLCSGTAALGNPQNSLTNAVVLRKQITH